MFDLTQYRLLCNHDQSMIWYLLLDGNSWVPFDCSDYAGNISHQNWKKTLTNSPTICFNFETGEVHWGTNFIIVQSRGKSNGHLGMSKQLENRFEKVGLSKGYNKDHDVFITSSHNGWNQEYNLDDQIEYICTEKGMLIELDRLELFISGEFVEKCLQKAALPGMHHIQKSNNIFMQGDCMLCLYNI